MLSGSQRAAVDAIGIALVDLGQGLRQLAAASVTGSEDTDTPNDVSMSLDALEAEKLWGRLGPGNRDFLSVCAARFEPGERFTLEEMAEAVGASTGTVKARLMNIGRSLKAMGNDFTVLWDTDWGLISMTYSWRPDAHRVIRSKAS